MRIATSWLILVGATGLLAAEPLPAEPLPFDVRPVQQGEASPFAAIMQLGAAQQALDSGDWAAARAGFQTVLLSDPELREARLGLAEAELSLGHPLAAQSGLGELHAPALRLLIDLKLGRLDDPDTALAHGFARLRDPRLANARGEWLDDHGRGRAARAAFLSAAAYQVAGTAENNIGLSYLRAGQLDRAQAAFDRAVALNPDAPLFARNRRLCALMRGDLAQALDGVSGSAASPLLREAGADALERGETRLAALLLERADSLSVRHDPRIAALRGEARRQALRDQRADPAENGEGQR